MGVFDSHNSKYLF